MNPIKLTRPMKGHKVVLAVARYGKPLNRWHWYYANEDGIYEEDFNWIEQKKMPIPFPDNSWRYSHKLRPDYYLPAYRNDFRYNYFPERLPRRHFAPDFYTKMVNFNDMDEMMHNVEWQDMVPDYQVEEPMSSNHYYLRYPPLYAIYAWVFVYVFVIVYFFWGWNAHDFFEDAWKFKKPLFPARAQFVFTYVGSFFGDKHNTVNLNEGDPRWGGRVDKEGNVLPNHIRRFPFVDEYTYRI